MTIKPSTGFLRNWDALPMGGGIPSTAPLHDLLRHNGLGSTAAIERAIRLAESWRPEPWVIEIEEFYKREGLGG